MAASTSSLAGAPPLSDYKPRYIDIGINLADPIFRGRYHGKSRHPDDLEGVVKRAHEMGCTKLIVTGSSFKSSRDALKLAAQFAGTVFSTAGIHPCSSSIFSPSRHKHHDESQSEGEGEPEAEHTPACGLDPTKPILDGEGVDHTRSKTIIADLKTLITSVQRPFPSTPSPLVAFGEFGLDYDRLHYCSKEVQLHSFAAQLELAASLTPQLPLFLHSRAAHADFVRLLKDAFGPRLERLEKGGVVHSFTGTVEEMRELMDLGLYIGINGCSFKTAENCDVVKEIELSRLMLETDGPWCEVRPSHEGWKYLVDAAKAASSSGTATPVPGAETPPAGQQPKKQGKKNQKKEPEVPDRFKVVKKEKWEEGAMVKGRNEPCTIERIATIVAGIKGVSVEEVCEAAWANTVKVFGVDQ
ncbi:endodeoxyribonuclease-like protein [Podospora aff. communis PSN243]|uniref:Endodeoxyribonuclease-like protein n=1 Tax=Podospora aff. communis PSN243 TaxID=3040156 RepID=A0AAV9GVQ6_9PEZI|nr:endodeoxyribonuclease-like protein [Podospora aff. communis PSN243]